MKKLSILLLLVFVITFTVGTANAIQKDVIFLVKKDAIATVNQMSPELNSYAVIMKEFTNRTGIDFAKDVFRAGFVGELNPAKKNVCLFVEGKFDVTKLVAELKKEMPELKDEKLGNYLVHRIKKGLVVYTESGLFFGVSASDWFATAAAFEATKNDIQSIKIADTFHLHVALNDMIRGLMVGKMKEEGKIPPQVIAMVEKLETMTVSFQDSELVIDAGLMDPDMAKSIAGMVVGFKGMGEMFLDNLEKQGLAEMKNVSAFKLFSKDVLGKIQSAELGRVVLKHLDIQAKENHLQLLVKMPAFLTSSPTSLLILTSVTGVLAAIAIPNFKKARSKAQGKACMANMRTIEGATEMYMMDNDENAPPVTLQLLVEGKYLRKEPTCSQGGEYSITKGDKYYECKCSVHGGIK